MLNDETKQLDIFTMSDNLANMGAFFAILALSVLGGSMLLADMLLGLRVLTYSLFVVTFWFYIRSVQANLANYKHFDAWVMLAPENRPPGEWAEKVVRCAVHQSYERWTRHFSMALGISLALTLIGHLALPS